MRETADYVDLITPAHREKPRFVATVAFSVDPLAAVQAFLKTLPEQFDLDIAVGRQLDAVGEWVGRSREIKVPVANAYFAFDDPIRGFDRGVWQGPYDQEYGISRLDDATYRRLLRAKIIANSWDGTTASAQHALDVFFDNPETYVFIQDNGGSATQANFFAFNERGRGFDESVWYVDGTPLYSVQTLDLSMIIAVAGKLPSAVYLAILEQSLIPLKPGAVHLDYLATSVDRAPLFGFDIDNQYIAGFDAGAWGVAPSEVASLSI